jgi:hypothetical protein
MKIKILAFFLLTFFCSLTVSGQNAIRKNSPAGQWKFESPYAPEGYTSGTLIVNFSDNKYSATISFPGNGYTFTGEKVRFEKDTLSFNFYAEGQDVTVKLALESENKLAGKGVYSEGEVPLTLERMEKK